MEVYRSNTVMCLYNWTVLLNQNSHILKVGIEGLSKGTIL